MNWLAEKIAVSETDANPAPWRWATAGMKLASFLRRVGALAVAHRAERRLRLCEMLSLGEKRFVAVVEYGQDKFLLAGTPQNIALLKRFERNADANHDSARPPADAE